MDGSYAEAYSELLKPEHLSSEELGNRFIRRLQGFGVRPGVPSASEQYRAAAEVVRDQLIRSYVRTQKRIEESGEKQVAYLSLEYLVGRSLQNAAINLDLADGLRSALLGLGADVEAIYQEEVDAGLGNGGLGRLAACFMDSLATLRYPAIGYGLLYRYGIFRQEIAEGKQHEHPDAWLSATGHSPWLIDPGISYKVCFGGSCVEEFGPHGKGWVWNPSEVVVARAHDLMVPGYHTDHTLPVRLWEATATHQFALDKFNQGRYAEAAADQVNASTITAVLYPMDNHPEGQELRLKQQYLFVSASLQDILKRFRDSSLFATKGLSGLPEFSAVQLNDTHPSLAVPELMRVLVDLEGMDWGLAWAITRRTLSYTNHTVLPEALEKWSVDLLATLLPRHLQIIYDINHFFLEDEVRPFLRSAPEVLEDSDAIVQRVSLVQETPEKRIRMANLSIAGSHAVNGVAQLHTSILKAKVFPTLSTMYPGKFRNKTNGVTPRRWVLQANPGLARLLTRTLGTGWETDLSRMGGLRKHADDAEFLRLWAEIKVANKARVASMLARTTGVHAPKHALLDVHIKRIHEYKRQLLNILSVVDRYLELKAGRASQAVPRVVVFAGKAAPGYFMAKLILRLIGAVASKVNADPDTNGMLQVALVPNYNVSVAEVLIPGADISQQTSCAGMEASGTGNMKFALNGALILGTMDGANVEIAERAGMENLFIFGAAHTEVNAARLEYQGKSATHQKGKGHADDDDGETSTTSSHVHHADGHGLSKRYSAVLSALEQGLFLPFPEVEPILYKLRPENDYYLVGHDFPSYIQAQLRADIAYADPMRWTKMAVLAAAGAGEFSSDRTITQYAEDIWDIRPLRHGDE